MRTHRAFGLLLSLACCFPMQLSSQEIRSIRADFVFPQKGAPLQVVGNTMALDEHYKRVFVPTVSNKKVLRAQLGWVLSSGQAGKKVETYFGPPADLNLSVGNRDNGSTGCYAKPNY